MNEDFIFHICILDNNLDMDRLKNIIVTIRKERDTEFYTFCPELPHVARLSVELSQPDLELTADVAEYFFEPIQMLPCQHLAAPFRGEDEVRVQAIHNMPTGTNRLT